jgi:hypothetical protein
VSKSKRRGTAAESAVVAYLQTHGYPLAERRALRGADDRGDIAGLPGAIVEVKDVAAVNLAGWLDEATAEAANARVPLGVVIRRRRGRPDVGQWFVVMSVDSLLVLLEDRT